MGEQASKMLSKVALCATLLVAITSAAPLDRMVNDQKAVDDINARTDILWKAGYNSKFDGQSLSSFKDLAGGSEDSLEQVLALPNAPRSLVTFGTRVTVDVAGHLPVPLLRRTGCASQLMALSPSRSLQRMSA